ncbi:MAG: DUF4178 domain-containing protein [candidate division NC10 bacterium]|nr:DUF4178 domain-containing protein [candidate division NC10 bacterium]
MKFASAVSLLSICPYCSSTLLRRDLDVENVGKMAELVADSSPLQLMAEGRYRGAYFTVVGRIQVEYSEGTWNEWFILFGDGRTGWLGEASGSYTVSFETPVQEAIPPWEGLHPGLQVTLKGRPYEVSDLREAKVVGGEGELPFRVGCGYAARVADLRTDSERFATLEYSDETPRVFLGEAVEFGALQLRGLRRFEGW